MSSLAAKQEAETMCRMQQLVKAEKYVAEKILQNNGKLQGQTLAAKSTSKINKKYKEIWHVLSNTKRKGLGKQKTWAGSFI